MASENRNTGQNFWQQHITQWQGSGLSQANYCRQQALPAHQFSYWKCKLLAGATTAPEPGTGFARVQVTVPAATTLAPGLSLCLRDGTRVTGIGQDNLGLLKQLLEVLR
jgi:hypothetical protein